MRDYNYEFDKEDFKTKVLYSRNEEPFDTKEIFNVFGHTPTKEPTVTTHFVNIDTGACYKKEFGVLTVLEFPSMRLITQENIEE